MYTNELQAPTALGGGGGGGGGGIAYYSGESCYIQT